MWQIYSSICGLSYATQNLLVKGITRNEVDSKTVLWFMFAGAVPFLFIFYWILAEPRYTYRFPFYLLSGVTLNLVAFYGYVRAIELADVSLVTPLISLSPLFMLLTSWLMVSEVPDPKGLIGILLVVLGTYFLAGGTRDFALKPLQKLVAEPGPRWALVVSIIWSVTANIDKLSVQASSPLTYTFWFHATFVLLFTPIFFSMKSGTLIPVNGGQTNRSYLVLITALLGAGGLQAILTATQMIAVIKTNVTYVIAIKRAGMLISVLGGGLLFNEEELPRRFFATILVLLGLLGIMFR